MSADRAAAATALKSTVADPPIPLMSFATGESALVTFPTVVTTFPTTMSAGPMAATIDAICTMVACMLGLSDENQFPTASIFQATVSKTGTSESRIFSPSTRPAFLILLKATVASSDESMMVPYVSSTT
jgi:hypothetical protein